MAQLIPVDHDPYSDPPINLIPVDHDPFATPKPGKTVPPLTSNALQAYPGQLTSAAWRMSGLGDVSDALSRGASWPEVVGAAVPAAMGAIQPEARGVGTAEEALAPALERGIAAYHGSPYDFDRFDISKIGIGQNAQSYGRGLYFADNPEVARDYQKTVSRKIPPTVDEAKRFAATKTPIQQGRMYQVSINADPEHFLDWDRTMGEQSDQVKDALQKAGFNVSNRLFSEGMPEDLARDPDTAARLRDAGIPGIKYLDQGSRGSGQGTSNYVVFDDKLIDIVKKYGLAGLIGGGAAHFSTVPVDHDPYGASQ